MSVCATLKTSTSSAVALRLHAGMVGKRVIEAMCRIRCSAEVASEFRYENPIIGKKDMCIVISQSG